MAFIEPTQVQRQQLDEIEHAQALLKNNPDHDFGLPTWMVNKAVDSWLEGKRVLVASFQRDDDADPYVETAHWEVGLSTARCINAGAEVDIS